MSIIRPHKLGVITGPGSEYLSKKILGHLYRLYEKRHFKLSEALAFKYGISLDDVKERISFIEDLGDRDIPHGKHSIDYKPPKFEVDVKYTRFLNGEVKAEILNPVRGRKIYIVYDITNSSPIRLPGTDKECVYSINDHLMFIFTTVQAAKLAGVEEVTLVLPTFPYARQHKKSSREALTAALFCQFCEALRIERIITLDIHCMEIENSLVNTHLENLHASYQILVQLKKLIDLSDPDITIVSPDTGAVARNKFYAQVLHRPLAVLYKERDYSKLTLDAKHSNIKSISLLGDVNNQTVIMADDMISSGGTMLIAMRTLREKGAKKIICVVSLPFFDGSAVQDFDEAYNDGVFDFVIGTNAVYHDDVLLSKPWFIQADISNLIARVITHLHHNKAISPLLDNRVLVQKLVDNTQSAQQSEKKQTDEQ